MKRRSQMYRRKHTNAMVRLWNMLSGTTRPRRCLYREIIPC